MFPCQNFVFICLFSHMCCMPRLSDPPWFNLIIIGEEYKLGSSLLCSLLHPPITSSLFGPNVPLSQCIDIIYDVNV
jgi:hypothetical protein